MYVFATPENKAAFEKAPERYAVQNHGLCQRMGGTTSGNPELFALHEGRIYLFGSEECVTRFKASPGSFIYTPAPVPAISAESARQAAALLERAAEGFGGAALVDGLQALRTVAVVTPPPPPAGSTMRPRQPQTTTTVIALPGRVRQEFRMGEMTAATVVTPEASYRFSQNTARDLREGHGAALLAEVRRSPLFLVRGRRDPGVQVWMATPSNMNGIPVDVVALASGAERATVAIDPASGRVLRFTYGGRGPDGVYGEVAHTFSEFKDAGGGLLLPHAVARAFNGTPYGSSIVYERIEANPAIDPALFTRPAAK
jgi:YHS domain-containing protein